MARAFVLPGVWGELERLYIDVLSRGYKITGCKAQEDGSYWITAEMEITVIEGGFCNEFRNKETIYRNYVLAPRN